MLYGNTRVGLQPSLCVMPISACPARLNAALEQRPVLSLD